MTCTLCHLTLPKHPIQQGEHAFCCPGCSTVFQILTTKQIAGDFRDHPLFREAATAGVLANPELVKEQTIEGEITREHFEIGGLWCPSCAELIIHVLLRIKGVVRATVDYTTDLAIVEFSPLHVSKEQIFERICRLGYQPAPLLSTRPGKSLWIRFGVAVFCALNLMMLSFPLYVHAWRIHAEGFEHELGWLSLALTLPLLYSGWPIWRRSLRLGMEMLITLGVGAAWLTSLLHVLQGEMTDLYFDSMAMILVFVLLGKLLERRAKFSAKEALYGLSRALPKRARRATGEMVLLKEVREGDRLVAYTGEKIVLDGTLEEGEGACDEALMTGEARLVWKRPGDAMVGGSFVTRGPLVYRAETTSLLSRVVDLVSRDLRAKKAPRPLVDRIARLFVPLVVLIALCSRDVTTAITVLLISCPCAIGIAAPLAEAFLIRRCTHAGAIVRNRHALSLLAQRPHYVFDKTGTLTDGKFEVLGGLGAHQEILKALALPSIHPVAIALAGAIDFPPVQMTVEEVVGRGMQGTFQGKECLLGSARFLQEKGIVASGADVYFTIDGQLISSLTLGERIRTVTLPPHSTLLSGDHPQAVQKVADHFGIPWHAECDPLEKRQYIRAMSRPVVMVGDGLNDTPAMAAADVSISLAETSLDVSDIFLTEIAQLTTIEKLAQQGQRIIHQNLFWAFAYNIVGIALAVPGVLTPLFAATAMVLSSTCVVLNSLRLSRAILPS